MLFSEMIVWVCMILVASASYIPSTVTRRLNTPIEVIPSPQPRGKLNDKEVIKALSLLLSEKITGKEQKQTKGDILNDALIKKESLEELRKGRQFGGVPQCETTGFETTIREECEEVSNIECKKVNVTMVRNEIGNRCKTMFDQKCNVTYKDVPTSKCSPYQRTR